MVITSKNVRNELSSHGLVLNPGVERRMYSAVFHIRRIM